MIAVITSTISSRSDLLTECKQSVRIQNPIGYFEHFIGTDNAGWGCARMRNEIVRRIPKQFDWLAFLDDDDLMLPNHLRTLEAASSNADIVYSDCRTEGWEKTWATSPFDFEKLRQRNFIPVTVLMRRSMFKQAEGFRSEPGDWPEDWNLWKRCARLNARFAYVPEVTWVYRRFAGRPTMLTTGLNTF